MAPVIHLESRHLGSSVTASWPLPQCGGGAPVPVAAGIPESTVEIKRLRMALTWAVSVWYVNS